MKEKGAFSLGMPGAREALEQKKAELILARSEILEGINHAKEALEDMRMLGMTLLSEKENASEEAYRKLTEENEGRIRRLEWLVERLNKLRIECEREAGLS